jgi:cytochrome c551/c552
MKNGNNILFVVASTGLLSLMSFAAIASPSTPVSLEKMIQANTERHLAADMPAIGKDHCGGCHAVEKKLYAPSFRDIAIKYRGDVDEVNKLTENINRGGMFGWNMSIRMPAKGLGASDREIEGMVKFIVSLSIADSSSK